MTTTLEILDRHLATFGGQDLEGVMSDYAPDAVMFFAGGQARGTAQLREAFTGMFAEWGKPGVRFELLSKIVDGANAVIHWNAQTADNLYQGACDAFYVRDGKIVSHFFSAHITQASARGATAS